MPNEVEKFCKLATEKGISVDDMSSCINAIETGRRMSESERKACGFLGEENTFWNPVTHLDYNWFRDNLEEIKSHM